MVVMVRTPRALEAGADTGCSCTDREFGFAGARAGRSGLFDVEPLVAEIALADASPVPAAFRDKPSGLETSRDGEHTWRWEPQGREERGEDPGPIPVPPRDRSSDHGA